MARADAPTKILLDESEIPTHWYNVVPDLPRPPAPVLHPGSGQPIGANFNPDYLREGSLGPYMAKNLGCYKCPADIYPDVVGRTRMRSVSMNFLPAGRPPLIAAYATLSSRSRTPIDQPSNIEWCAVKAST